MLFSFINVQKLSLLLLCAGLTLFSNAKDSDCHKLQDSIEGSLNPQPGGSTSLEIVFYGREPQRIKEPYKNVQNLARAFFRGENGLGSPGVSTYEHMPYLKTEEVVEPYCSKPQGYVKHTRHSFDNICKQTDLPQEESGSYPWVVKNDQKQVIGFDATFAYLAKDKHLLLCACEIRFNPLRKSNVMDLKKPILGSYKDPGYDVECKNASNIK